MTAGSRSRCSRSGSPSDRRTTRSRRSDGIAHVIPLTVAARDVMFEEHQVPFFDALVGGENAADFGEIAHVLVTHDERGATQRQAILADVGPTDAGDRHFQQRRVGRDLGQIHLAQLGARWPHFHRGQHFFGQPGTSTQRLVLNGHTIGCKRSDFRGVPCSLSNFPPKAPFLSTPHAAASPGARGSGAGEDRP